MSTFVILVNYTDQGIRNIKDSVSRLEQIKILAEQLGGKVRDFYVTLGVYDIVAIVDLPSDVACATFVFTTGSLGSVRTTTLKAFKEEEYREIIASIP